jgi:mannose-6-phosphate isomerase-like protein (cupin superfamily)
MTEGTLKRGYVVDSLDVAGTRDEGDTCTTQVTIGAAHGSLRLEQRVLRFAPGRSQPRENEGHEEILFVVAGRGTLHLNGEPHALEPEIGAYVAPGQSSEIEGPGPGNLVLVAVLYPEPDEGPRDPGLPVTVRYADQPAHRAGKDREFRHLIDTHGVTQFVGSIPPGRAKDHYHLYEEVAYILEGEGILHMEGLEDTPFHAGTCILFTPQVPHCVENTGTSVVRVLGVFYPPGSPADAYNLPD